eukprot:m.143207 g.143207  ORF g.143207 m.143207 type:complete len:273 (+) comp30301_c0_seq2:61-879(+)
MVKFGDAVSVGVLTSIMVYLGCVVAHASGAIDLAALAFGKNWERDGFCISFQGTLFDSHLLCFYTDTVFAAVLYYLVFVRADGKYKDQRELRPVRTGVVSTFMHGVAHANLWYFQPKGDGPVLDGLDEEYHTSTIHALAFAIFFCFFFAFTNPHWPSKTFVFVQSVLNTYLSLYVVPLLYAFTFVNTIIFFNINLSRVALEKNKDRFYNAASMSGVLPMLVTWFEPLFCDAFLIDWGGHVWFDVSIPVANILYFFVATHWIADEARDIKKSH